MRTAIGNNEYEWAAELGTVVFAILSFSFIAVIIISSLKQRIFQTDLMKC